MLICSFWLNSISEETSGSLASLNSSIGTIGSMSDSGTSVGSLVLICGFSRGLGLRIGVVCIFCSKFGSLASGSGNEVLSVGLGKFEESESGFNTGESGRG